MLKVFSFGGGVQSTAALVLAAQGKIDYQKFIFCNVGNDSENPATIEYVEQYAKPYAAAHGVELIELQRYVKGEPVTIYGRLMKPNSRSIDIPVRMSNGAPGNRSCTVDFKVKLVDKWLKDSGVRDVLEAEKKSSKLFGGLQPRPLAMVGLGISLDEFQRMHDSREEWKQNDYPLIDLRIDRAQCFEIIRESGLPIPPKSSCYFCPFHRPQVWQEMRTNEPDLFRKAADLEDTLNERRKMLGKDAVYLTKFGKPLRMVTTDLIQGQLFDSDDEKCADAGYCMI
jgi:hypothetical protein